MQKRYKFRTRAELHLISQINKNEKFRDWKFPLEEKEPELFSLDRILYKRGKIHITEKDFRQNQEFIDSVFAKSYETKVGDYQESIFNYQLKVLNVYVKKLKKIYIKRQKLPLYRKTKYISNYFLKTDENMVKFFTMLIVSLIRLYVSPDYKSKLDFGTTMTFSSCVQALRTSIFYEIVHVLFTEKMKSEELLKKDAKQSYNACKDFVTQEFEEGLEKKITTICIDFLETLSALGKLSESKAKEPSKYNFITIFTVQEGLSKNKFVDILDLGLLRDSSLINYHQIFRLPRIYPQTYNDLIQNMGDLVIGNDRDDKRPEYNLLNFHKTNEGEYPALKTMASLQNTAFCINIKVLDFVVTKYDSLVKKGILTAVLSQEELKIKHPESQFKRSRLFRKSIQHNNIECIIISLSLYFSKYKNLYFDIGLDRRGRAYYKSSFLSIQNLPLAKALLQFSNPCSVNIFSEHFDNWVNTGLSLLGLKNKINYVNTKTNFELLKQVLKPLLNQEITLLNFIADLKQDNLLFVSFFFEYLVFKDNKSKGKKTFSSRFLAHLDATTSSFQIVSSLTKDKKMLEMSNITNTGDKPKDIYMDFVDKTINDFINIPFNERKDVQTFRYDGRGRIIEKMSLDLTEKDWGELQQQCNKESFKTEVLRPAVKHFAMSYGPYNMSAYTGGSLIYKRLKPFIESDSQKRYFRSVFFDVLKRECRGQKVFSTFLSKLVEKVSQRSKTQEPFCINISSFFSITLFYNKVERINVLYNLPHKRQVRVTLAPFIKPKKVEANLKKNMSTFPPNFIHHLDAIILFEVCFTLFEQAEKISLGTNHDCFFTHVTKFKCLKKAYSTAFQKVLGNPSVLFKKIFQQNNLNVSSELHELEKVYVNSEFLLDMKGAKYYISY